MALAPKKVITYSRVSTDKQVSIPDQQRLCRDFAAARGWTIAAEYVDDAISGAAIGNRPALQRALAGLKDVCVLLGRDIERISRSQELAPLIERIGYRRARVLGVTDNFDSDSS